MLLLLHRQVMMVNLNEIKSKLKDCEEGEKAKVDEKLKAATQVAQEVEKETEARRKVLIEEHERVLLELKAELLSEKEQVCKSYNKNGSCRELNDNVMFCVCFI